MLLPGSLIPVSLTPDAGNAGWRLARHTTLTTIATPATRENERPECSAEQQNAGKGNHFGSPVKSYSGRNQCGIFQRATSRCSDGERLRRRWLVTGVALLISAPR